ncbi:MAG TPA: hypothetical protein PK156_32705, partial [Polyangium sp.]|nr:hypothetical protein [Polyangium sp.]
MNVRLPFLLGTIAGIIVACGYTSPTIEVSGNGGESSSSEGGSVGNGSGGNGGLGGNGSSSSSSSSAESSSGSISCGNGIKEPNE